MITLVRHNHQTTQMLPTNWACALLALMCLLCLTTANISANSPGSGMITWNSGSPETDVDTLVKWLVGEFSNTVQHQRDTTVDVQHLTITSLGAKPSDEHWLRLTIRSYDPDTTQSLDAILHISKLEEGMIECALYSIDTNGMPRQKQIGCEWYLQYSGSSFLGGTHGFACTSIPGSTYSSTNVEVRNFGVKLWIRAYDNDHNQLSSTSPYPFLFERYRTNGAVSTGQ